MTAEEPQIWFFFNELSGRVAAASAHQGHKLMDDMVSALAAMMKGSAATLITVGEPNLWAVELASGYTVSNWLRRADPDLKSLLLLIASKGSFPEVDEALRDRYYLSEFALPEGREDGSADRSEARGLGAAFLFAGIGVSLLSEDRWSRIRIPLRQTWLDEDCQENTSDVNALNLSESSQVEGLSELLLKQSRRSLQSDPLTLPDRKRECFPHLVFGQDVDSQFKALPRGILATVVNKLVALDGASRAWRADSAMTLPNLPKCHDESEPTMQQFGDLRRFRDPTGSPALFTLHAMVGSAYRIHLRVVHDPRGIQVGYIGRHLDTVKHR